MGWIRSLIGLASSWVRWLIGKNEQAAQHDRGVQAEEVAKNQGEVLREVADAKKVSDDIDAGLYRGLSKPGGVTADDGYRRD